MLIFILEKQPRSSKIHENQHNNEWMRTFKPSKYEKQFITFYIDRKASFQSIIWSGPSSSYLLVTSMMAN